MEESFHYQLMSSHINLQKQLFASLKHTGLTSGQPKILDYLQDHNGATQKDIALACHIEAASLTSILSGMEKKGMIERKALNGNRRSLHVFLTEKGWSLQKEVAQKFASLEELAFSGFSAEQRETFNEMFRLVYENLTAHNEK